MNNQNALPEDFDGIFRFTNFTKNPFKASWGGIEYEYDPESTTPMLIPGATPEEVQNIRKKFARELAIREFYETEKFKRMDDNKPGDVPALYTESDIAPLVQKCLESLPISRAKTTQLPKADESHFSKDEEGNNVTSVLDKKKSLLQEGSTLAA